MSGTRPRAGWRVSFLELSTSSRWGVTRWASMAPERLESGVTGVTRLLPRHRAVVRKICTTVLGFLPSQSYRERTVKSWGKSWRKKIEICLCTHEELEWKQQMMGGSQDCTIEMKVTISYINMQTSHGRRSSCVCRCGGAFTDSCLSVLHHYDTVNPTWAQSLLLFLPQISCSLARVTSRPAGTTLPCGGSSSSSSGGSASMSRAVAPCPSNCTTSGGRGCKKPTGCASR